MSGFGRGENAWRLRDTTGRHVFADGTSTKVLAKLANVRVLIEHVQEKEAQS